MVGDAAPQPAQHIIAVGADLAGPAAPSSSTAFSHPAASDERVGAAAGPSARIERAGQRQRLDDRRIVAARHIGHQRAHPPRMLGERAQILARARARRGVSSAIEADAGVDR